MDIIFLYGGRSGEHEISIKSCTSVVRATGSEHNISLIAITKNGEWYLQEPSQVKKIKEDKNTFLKITTEKSQRVSVLPGGGLQNAFYVQDKKIPCDVVFPVLHGTYGEDGTIQGLLEMLGVPYVGCGVLSSAVTMDKITTKILWESAGLPVVPYRLITRADVNDSEKYDTLVKEAVESLKFPLFVKPCSAGSSDGANKACNERELQDALREAFLWDNKVLIEKAINAREVECSVTGNSVTSSSEKPETLLTGYGPGEIVPKHTFYDYDAKYNDPDGAELKIPALLTTEQLDYIKSTAKKAYKAVDASGLSRVDFFVDRDTGKIYLNEINTLPGFTNISMFPKMCESEGLDFTNLIDLLCREALARFKARESLTTSRT
mgnify:FL=1